MNMTITTDMISFEQIGSGIDRFLSKLEEHYREAVPSATSLKSTIINAPLRMKGNFPTDLAETEDAFIVTCEMPGIEKDNIQIKLINSNTITVKATITDIHYEERTYLFAERGHESKERTIVLPSEVTADNVKATFRNGVIEITLPKVKTECETDISIE